MDDELTQPSTQPFFDPRREGRSDELTPEDASDILITLHPTTHSAIEAARACARETPQHVLQNTGVPGATHEFHDGLDAEAPITDPRDDMCDVDIDETQPLPVAPISHEASVDLALRFSSKVRDPSMGWVFGRDIRKSDILLQAPEDKRTVRISGMHFRIYVTGDGIIMLQDTSTNGTHVDNVLLRRTPGDSKRTLAHGSVISVIVRTDKVTKALTWATFIVRIPERSGTAFLKYGNNLHNYINSRLLVRAGAPNGQTPSYNLLGLGSIRSNHGMKWNGGEKYSVIGVVGKGAFAAVYKLAEKSAGTVFAAKEIDKIKFMKNGELDSKIGNELRIIKSLKHPHIVKYCDYQDERDNLYIIMEYVAHGDMSAYMAQGPVPEDLTRSISRQLCQALKYIHDEGVTHRDIKPDNILIAVQDPMVVKLTDFGLSKLADGPGGAPMKTFCGTLLYCAPEVYPDFQRLRNGTASIRMLGKPPEASGERVSKRPSTYSRKVDMWSLAAVLFHMLAGDAPYTGTAENQGQTMLRNILTRRLDVVPLAARGCSNDCMKFVEQLMMVDPVYRPTAASTLEHAWLTDVPDVAEIPLCRSEIEASLLAALNQDNPPNEYESDYDDTGFSSRVAALSSQVGPGDFVDINDENLAAESLFDTQLPPPARPPLFGEIRTDGLPDSGIFGLGQQPTIQGTELTTNVPAIRTRPLSREAEGDPIAQEVDVENQELQSTTSHLHHLDVGSDDGESLKYDSLPSPSLLVSGVKRPRPQPEEGLTASKRFMLPNRSHVETSEFFRLIVTERSC